MTSPITILIPTYNRADYLAQALKSLLSQSFRNWQANVVDNASTDHTSQVVKSISDQRIAYYRQPVNAGAICNWLLAVHLVNTKYFAFLADDDMYRPDFLLKRVQFLDANPQMLACFGDYASCDEYGNIIEDGHNIKIDAPQTLAAKDSLKYLNPYSHYWQIGSAVYRSDPVISWMTSQSVFAGKAGDTALKLRIASVGKASIVPGVDYIYRSHPNQDSSIGGRKEIMIGHMTAWLYNYLFWSSSTSFHSTKSQCIWALKYVAAQLLDEQEYANARRTMRFALLLAPIQPLLILRYLKYLLADKSSRKSSK